MIFHNKKRRNALIGILSVFLLGAGGAGIYVQDYYHADAVALEVAIEGNAENTIKNTVENTTEDTTDNTAENTVQNTAEDVTEGGSIEVVNSANDEIAFIPENPIAGLIFYPGGKVQYEAYAPLMRELAERNILCVLLHMPCNLAVLDMNAADGIQAKYPEIENWYLAGHSLGGAMAASYAGKHMDEYRGLILLAAYSTADLSESNLKVLTVYGTEDEVMKRESYDKYMKNLPENWKETVIDGGCHAYFGHYGEQKGDGTPEITREEQIQQTVDAILGIITNDGI